MTRYRICTVGRDGRFAGPPQISECANDQEAIRLATQAANGHVVEIWDFKRFVVRIIPATQNHDGATAPTEWSKTGCPPANFGGRSGMSIFWLYQSGTPSAEVRRTWGPKRSDGLERVTNRRTAAGPRA